MPIVVSRSFPIRDNILGGSALPTRSAPCFQTGYAAVCRSSNYSAPTTGVSRQSISEVRGGMSLMPVCSGLAVPGEANESRKFPQSVCSGGPTERGAMHYAQ